MKERKKMLTEALNDRKSHYLTRLGILDDVQALFVNTYEIDATLGGILFDYGDDELEHYGFAFHKVPSVPTFWKAGCIDTNIVTDVIIGSSALNIIAYMSYKFRSYSENANILFLSAGSRLYNSHLDLIRSFKNKRITTIFDNDFLGKVADIKVASAFLGHNVVFTLDQDQVVVEYRESIHTFETSTLSLDAFRKAFKVRIPLLRTHKSKGLNFIQDHIKLAF